jgi:hypothetical protein
MSPAPRKDHYRQSSDVGDLSLSNSLVDLAARINAEHETVTKFMKQSLEGAIRAGKLLIEAKAQLKYGQWLPWLREHCQVPERTVQLYMRLARHAPEIRNVADLTVRGAIEQLAPPPPAEPDWDDWDSISEWAERQLNSPFNGWDFPANGDTNFDWVKTKLMHQAKLPWVVVWCIDVAKANDGFPAFRLSPWDDLCEAARALAPYVSDDDAETEQPFRFDFGNMRSMQGAMAVVQLETMWILGGVLREIEYRREISDERYEAEWDETHKHVMAGLEKQLAALQNVEAP